VRALAVTSLTRLDQLPDVPPMAQFLPGYEANGWSGLCAPRNTSAEIVGLLNEQINDALADPTMRQRIADMGGIAPGGTPTDFANYITDEIEKWAKVAAFAGIKAD
jgi:tripartite-type tricarboxylate transporter receptor subunit TctC